MRQAPKNHIMNSENKIISQFRNNYSQIINI